ELRMAVTEVILKENIPGLGAEADVVKVRRGFARNFLVPQGKAYEVTPANLKRLNLLKAKRAKREARELNESEELARRINKVKLDFTLETGETGKAFGSVTAKDIEDKLFAEAEIKVDRHRIRIERPIKESGEIEVPIQLHADVTATLKIEVKAHTPAPKEPEPEAKDSKSKTRKRTKTTAS
ncbi:MAG TPA: 50S ribosomal protein L9, partial [Chthoniobacterales bacterium]|nr:50S ribosomal protein L9 [Chthoniobacterales bacterium]